MDRAGGVHRAGVGDLAHHQRGLRDAQSAAAEFLGDRHSQVPGLGDGLVEVVREFVRGVLGAPVLVVEARAHRAHAPHDFLLCLGQIEIHVTVR